MTTEITDKEIMKQTLDNGMSKKFIITTDVWVDVYEILGPSNGKYWHAINAEWHKTQVFEDEIRAIQDAA